MEEEEYRVGENSVPMQPYHEKLKNYEAIRKIKKNLRKIKQ